MKLKSKYAKQLFKLVYTFQSSQYSIFSCWHMYLGKVRKRKMPLWCFLLLPFFCVVKTVKTHWVLCSLWCLEWKTYDFLITFFFFVTFKMQIFYLSWLSWSEYSWGQGLVPLVVLTNHQNSTINLILIRPEKKFYANCWELQWKTLGGIQPCLKHVGCSVSNQCITRPPRV